MYCPRTPVTSCNNCSTSISFTDQILDFNPYHKCNLQPNCNPNLNLDGMKLQPLVSDVNVCHSIYDEDLSPRPQHSLLFNHWLKISSQNLTIIDFISLFSFVPLEGVPLSTLKPSSPSASLSWTLIPPIANTQARIPCGK